jgi:hypothetical protein
MAKKIEQQILDTLGIKAYLVRQAGLYRVQPDAEENPEFAVWDAQRQHTHLPTPVEAALAFADRLGRFELERQAAA